MTDVSVGTGVPAPRRPAEDGLDSGFRNLLESAPDAMVLVAGDGTIVLANTQTERLFGYRVAELVEQPVDLLVPDSLRERHRALRTGYVGHPSVRPMGQGLELMGARRDGSYVPVEISLAPVALPDGRTVYCAAVRDVTARKESERTLRASEERLRLTFEASPIGMALIDLEGRLLDVNDALCQLTGCSRQALVHQEQVGLTHDDVEAVARDGLVHRMSRAWTQPDGSTTWVDVTLAVVRGLEEQPLHLVAQFVDTTEQRLHQDELGRLALTDALTGLPNRTLLLDRAGQSLAALNRAPGRVTLYLLDLDHFKHINDTYGHPAGDLLLQEVATRLRAMSRSEDTVARFGGDEFALLSTEPFTSDSQVSHGERVLSALTEPITLATSQGEREVVITGSIGVAWSSDPTTPASDLYRDADLALYRAKDEGRARVSVYDRSLSTALSTRMAQHQRLRRALRDEGVRVVYQPIVSLRDGTTLAYEALVRLVDPDSGELLPADEFLPAARDSGLVPEVDQRVLTQCLTELSRPDGPRALHVNVGVSSLSGSAWTETLLDAVRQAPSMSKRICIEVTEHTLMHVGGPGTQNLARLRREGIAVGLDDFGTGYSALSYLQQLSVDFLKLDMTLVSDICRDARAATLTRGITELAHALGLRVVAEGVRSEEQQALLASWGCDAAQGYFLGHPAPLP